jgi:deoxyuridine 5'-triphosphate nucleotidohydrolase
MNNDKLDYMPEIKFKKTHELAKLPTKTHDNDTGWDLYSVADTVIPAKSAVVVPVGLTVAYISPGYWFQISPRSGMGFKGGIQPHLGVIDEGYRNDLAVKLYNFSNEDYSVKAGDRIAQAIIHYNIDIEVKWGEVEPSVRHERGLGSSGK